MICKNCKREIRENPNPYEIPRFFHVIPGTCHTPIPEEVISVTKENKFSSLGIVETGDYHISETYPRRLCFSTPDCHFYGVFILERNPNTKEIKKQFEELIKMIKEDQK